MTSPLHLLQRPPDPATPTVATDLEGTITEGAVERGLRDHLAHIGRGDEARQFYRSHLPGYFFTKLFRRNFQQFKNDWLRGLLLLYRGLPLAEFQEACAWVVENSIWPTRRPPVVAELESHLAAGRRVIIVTGMFDPLLTALLQRIPGAEAIGTAIIVEDAGTTGATFSGRLATDFQIGAAKRENLLPFVPPSGKIYAAYGDTWPDHYMLELAERPVAVAPDKKLRAAALQRGWRILEGV